MEIVPATVDDAESILALQHLAYQTEAAIYDDFTLPPLTETLEDLKARFGDRRFLKAVEDRQLVGSVRAFQDGATCQVEWLIVHPDYRCRGIGTALLDRIETLFPTARRFELFTGNKSAGNLRLYERLG
jgi:ribosomal protein S18 acetylase RimI-like enzyme